MPTSRVDVVLDSIMVIEVLSDPDEDPLSDLWGWLREDLPRVRWEPVWRPVEPGEMGSGVLSALQATFLSKEVLAMVATGISGWLAARTTSRRTKIRVKYGDSEVEIDTADMAEAEIIVRRLIRGLRAE